MNTDPRSRLAAAALTLLAVSFAASSCGPRKTVTADTSAAPPAKTDNRFADSVARAALRERALTILDQTAASTVAEERANALEALQHTPERLRSVVGQGLRDETAGVRGIAAMVVGRVRLKDFAEDTRPLLSDPETLVRISAMYALRRCGKDVDISPLAEYLRDQRAAVRAQAAFVLGELGDASAIPMLRDAVKDQNLRASTGAARVMELQFSEARAKLGDAEALHELRAALYPGRPEDLEPCALACQILGEVKDRASTDRLVHLTTLKGDDKNPMPAEIRLAAAGALAKMGLRQGSFIAAEYAAAQQETHRAQAAYVFGETGQISNLAALETLLDDPAGRVRVSAAGAIIRITDGSSRR